MRILGLHHVAFAHSAAATTVEALESLLGLQVEMVEEAEGFTERMLPVGDGTFVQTLQVTGPGVVERFVKRRGTALHHIAFEVDDINAAVADLLEKGARLVDAQPRPGGMGTLIAFVHPESFGGLLVELVQVTGH